MQVCARSIAALVGLMSFQRMCFANKYKIALCNYFCFVLVLIPSNVSTCCECCGNALEFEHTRGSLDDEEEGWECGCDLPANPRISISGTTMTPSGGDLMNSGHRITTSRISDECLTTAPQWATTARDPQTITALSTQTNWGNTNSPCPHSL